MRLAAIQCAMVLLASGVRASTVVSLPIEVTGGDGAEVAVAFDMERAADAAEVRALWMQVHGLEYEGLASVRVNDGPWVSLTNKSVSIAEPGKSYGGIGGGFGTLKLSLTLAAGSIRAGGNNLHFRFNHTNGVVSGYRVLAFNLLNSDGKALLPAAMFAEENPNLWRAPLSGAADIAAGKALWTRGPLVANGLAGAGPIRAHCADCHTADGRDLKYFNYSNAAIVARSRFHGLSEREGEQIASYIRTLNFANPGRPWNPPYQPGPGLDEQPVQNWAAGAGLAAVLEQDNDTLNYLFPDGITAGAFRPDGDLNGREIPIAMQLPDWNHWLPHIHPMDAFGERFAVSSFAALYDGARDSAMNDSARFFDDWSKARVKFLDLHLAPNSKKWNAELSDKVYAAQLWQLVKTWELTQQYGWERQPGRSWPNTMAAASAPTFVNIPDTAAGMAQSGLLNEYFSSAWYQLQIELNSGNHRHHGKGPLNWTYLIEHFRDLETLSGRAEPGRLLITLIKALQSSDPAIGPENVDDGWRPERTVDPRILVTPEWTAAFAPLDQRTKRAITQAMLRAWLDKTQQYPMVKYFQLGNSASNYAPPVSLRNIAGGRAWESAEAFRGAGVDEKLVARLETWGKTYVSMASLFHY